LRTKIRLLPLVGLSLAACADKPEVDEVAQTAMIGLSSRDIQACLGEPARRRRVAQATEIWTYPVGYTATEAPPWAAGLDFALSAKPVVCDVRLVMTNAHVSQVTYALPDARALPLGRQCVFAVQACALRRERL
jgi:LmbE family N-acetylglucosaminyl deacetylase